VEASPGHARLSIRGVLLLGFGLTLCLWLFSGYYFSRRITELQQQSTRVTARYVRAQARMSAVRSQVLLASVYVRDALLDPAPESIVDYRMKLDDAFAIIDRALVEYEPVLDSVKESSRVQQLRAQIREFQAAILKVLQSDSTRWQTHAMSILRDEIMPKREQAVEVSEDVQSINRGAYIDQQAATTEFYRIAQQRIWTQFGLAIAASFFIGLLAIRHVAGMERELRRQQQRDARTSADMQRLSAQLISAQEDERRTIARELHDEIGQALTAIKVELALAERAMGHREEPGEALHTVRNLTEGALHTVRDLSRLLHPAVLDDIGLAAALHAYVRDFRKRYDMEVGFEAEAMDCRLPPDAEAAAYRIVQEALTNVARHASATSCRVTLRRRDDLIELAVEDDGVGFDAEAQRNQIDHAGLGLLGMRERAVRLSGSCVVDSAPGRGTRVLVTLPLHERTVAAGAERTVGSILFGHLADA
jgi:signal transduction histidine kinase